MSLRVSLTFLVSGLNPARGTLGSLLLCTITKKRMFRKSHCSFIIISPSIHKENDYIVATFNINGKEMLGRLAIGYSSCFPFVDLATSWGTNAHHAELAGERNYINLHNHTFSLLFWSA